MRPRTFQPWEDRVRNIAIGMALQPKNKKDPLPNGEGVFGDCMKAVLKKNHLFEAIVGSLFGDDDIMGVALPKPSIRDTHETGHLTKLFDGA